MAVLPMAKKVSIKDLALFLGWEYSKVYRLVRLGRIKSDESSRGVAMKDRRISMTEARRIKKLKEAGEPI